MVENKNKCFIENKIMIEIMNYFISYYSQKLQDKRWQVFKQLLSDQLSEKLKSINVSVKIKYTLTYADYNQTQTHSNDQIKCTYLAQIPNANFMSLVLQI